MSEFCTRCVSVTEGTEGTEFFHNGGTEERRNGGTEERRHERRQIASQRRFASVTGPAGRAKRVWTGENPQTQAAGNQGLLVFVDFLRSERRPAAGAAGPS